MEKNKNIYKIERSRMVALFSLIKGPFNDLLRSRYASKKNLFSGVAEMVAILTTVYHDDNQNTKTRRTLVKIIFNPINKIMDIYIFIGKINILTDRANIFKLKRKTLLYEHIPVKLNIQLFDDVKNPDISYEFFVNKIANVILVN